MVYGWLADALLVAHFGFIAFVVLGGLLVGHWPKLAWLHLPALLWGLFAEYSGVVCPLTPLENTLRRMGGEVGYQGSFIGHYLVAVIYPEGLTREAQFALGTFALLVNLAVYWRLVIIRRMGRGGKDTAGISTISGHNSPTTSD